MSEFMKQANSTKSSFDWSIFDEFDTTSFLMCRCRDSVGEHRYECLVDEEGWN